MNVYVTFITMLILCKMYSLYNYRKRYGGIITTTQKLISIHLPWCPDQEVWWENKVSTREKHMTFIETVLQMRWINVRRPAPKIIIYHCIHPHFHLWINIFVCVKNNLYDKICFIIFLRLILMVALLKIYSNLVN